MAILFGTRRGERLEGGPNGDLLLGFGGNDELLGLGGSDQLYGMDGDDRLWGGAGNDWLFGGAGADTLVGGEGDDLINGGQGYDVGEFSGNVQDYDFSRAGVSWVVQHSRGAASDGVDLVYSVEELRFANATILLNGTNNAPIGADDAATTAEDQVLNAPSVLANDWDFEGSALSVVAVNGNAGAVGTALPLPSGARVTMSANGTYQYDPNGAFDGLDEGESQIDTFSYTVSDGAGGQDVVEVSITVEGVGGGEPSEPILFLSGYPIGGNSDRELWRFDGVEATMIKTNPVDESDPRNLTAVGDSLYFSAYDENFDEQLWRYELDGTLTKLDYLGSALYPQRLFAAGNVLYFSGESGGDRELWKYDGATLTEIEINPTGDSNPSEFVLVGGELYFSAFDGTETELFFYDGTGTTATKIDLNPDGDSNPQRPAVFGGAAYYTARDSATTFDIFRVSGGVATDLDLVPAGQFASELTAGDTLLYYRIGAQVWKYDGVTATPLAMPAGTTAPEYLTTIGDDLYMRIVVSGESELWRYDAGDDAFYKIDANPLGSSHPYNLTAAGDDIYFRGLTSDGDDELLRYDPETDTVTNLDINPNGSSGPYPGDSAPAPAFRFPSGGDGIAFRATDGVDNSAWVFDGSDLIRVVTSAPRGSSDPQYLTTIGTTLYFRATDGMDTEIFSYDGTSVAKLDIDATGSSSPQFLAAIGDTLYFQATDGVDADGANAGLWFYDTASDTQGEIDLGPGLFDPSSLTAAGDTLYFLAYNLSAGSTDLFMVDTSSPTPTAINIDASEGENLDAQFGLTALGGDLYFHAHDPDTFSTSLWRYDAANGALNDLGVGLVGTTAAAGGKLYFAYNGELGHYDPVNGLGTFDLNADEAGNDPTLFAAIGTDLYLTYNDGSGPAFYRFDTTDNSAHLIDSGGALDPATFNPFYFAEAGGKVYFRATDTGGDMEVWELDPLAGTAVRATDINAAGGSDPEFLAARDGKLYFGAWDGTDTELYEYDPGTATLTEIEINALGAPVYGIEFEWLI
jgi:ELWxxDGT repeat protein/VCBS repeat-containing protein